MKKDDMMMCSSARLRCIFLVDYFVKIGYSMKGKEFKPPSAEKKMAYRHRSFRSHDAAAPSRISLRERIARWQGTTVIFVLTCIISVVSFVFWILNPESIAWSALQPARIVRGEALWTLVTHMFVHGGPLHLMVNMMVLLSLGMLCERIIGKRRFVWLYLIAGVSAGVLSVLAAWLFGSGRGVAIVGSPEEFMVGASGAIFAIAGVLMVLLPRLRFSIIFLPFFSLPAYIMVPAVLLATWIVSILAGWNIGNVAHMGGFAVGALYGAYLRMKYQRKVKLLERYFT